MSDQEEEPKPEQDAGHVPVARAAMLAGVPEYPDDEEINDLIGKMGKPNSVIFDVFETIIIGFEDGGRLELSHLGGISVNEII